MLFLEVNLAAHPKNPLHFIRFLFNNEIIELFFFLISFTVLRHVYREKKRERNSEKNKIGQGLHSLESKSLSHFQE